MRHTFVGPVGKFVPVFHPLYVRTSCVTSLNTVYVIFLFGSVSLIVQLNLRFDYDIAFLHFGIKVQRSLLASYLS